MIKKYINDAIYLVNDGTSVYPIYGCDAEREIAENEVEIVAGPYADTPQNRHKVDDKCEQLNDEINGVSYVYEGKKPKTIYLSRDQIKRLNDMDVSLNSDGTVAGAQDVVNKNQAQFTQAKSMDGQKPNAMITSPKTDNSKPTAYIQSNPGESPAQAISDNSDTVQKAFDNNGSISVEVNENKRSITKKDIMENIKKRKKISENSNRAPIHAQATINILDKNFINELVNNYDVDPEDIKHYIIYDESVPEEITFTINGTQETAKGDYDTPDYISTKSNDVEFDGETINWLQEIPAELADAIIAYANDYAQQNSNSLDWSEPESDFGDENEFLSEAYISKILKESAAKVIGLNENFPSGDPNQDKWLWLEKHYSAQDILDTIFEWTDSAQIAEWIQWFEKEGWFDDYR